MSAEGLTSIVSEYMAGGSLETLFRAEELLPLRQSVKMALDCARGMAYYTVERHFRLFTEI